MTFLKNILFTTLVFGICATSYADETIIMASTENPSYAIQKIQEQLSKLQAHVYTVLPLDAQESMSNGMQNPEGALENFENNRGNAQLGTKVQELRNDIADLRGKLEEVMHVMELQAKKMEELEQQFTTALAQISTAKATFPPPTQESTSIPPVPSATGNPIIVATAVDSTATTEDPKSPPSTVPATETVTPSKTATLTIEEIVANEIKALDPKSAYEKSKEYISQGDYDKAEMSLKTFVETFPEHELTGAGYYYLGELYYIQKKFQEAVGVFAEGYQAQPKGIKASDTLLKMAQCFDALKKPKEACATLTRLHKSFPKLESSIKSTAKKLGTQLKCPLKDK